MIKFLKKGIRVNGEYFPGHYSIGNYTPESKIAASTISFYSKSYTPIPKIEGLTVENNSDIMTDLFEKDRIRIATDSPFYAAAKKAIQA